MTDDDRDPRTLTLGDCIDDLEAAIGLAMQSTRCDETHCLVVPIWQLQQLIDGARYAPPF